MTDRKRIERWKKDFELIASGEGNPLEIAKAALNCAPRQKPVKAQRGRKDLAYLRWIRLQPCMVTGERGATAHHVRRFGEPKDDRRTVPLVSRLHMLTHERPGEPCVERGKKVFEEYWRVDLEKAIVHYQQLYEVGRKA